MPCLNRNKRLFFALVACVLTACQAGSDRSSELAGTTDGLAAGGDAADAGTDGTTGSTGTPPSAAAPRGVLGLDGTYPGQKLSVGGDAMPWPPAGVAQYPEPGTACSATLSAKGTVPKSVPGAYYQTCAGCHGPAGTGAPGYPNVKNTYTYEAFAKIVRGGRTGKLGVMPAYDASHLAESDLVRIFGYLTGAAVSEASDCAPVAKRTAAAIDGDLARGLASWRKQDPAGHDGIGCFQCHGTDAVTFAYVGVSEGDVMRRALKHVSADDAWGIIDMIRAYREKYAIPMRDPSVVRPLQPGGYVLDGNTAGERDLAFGRQLQAMGLTWATKPIASVEDARKAGGELAKLNLHALPIPVPFNHLAEDKFHNTQEEALDCSADIDGCTDHGSISDWMPIQPHVPPNSQEFFAATDAYLANPTLDQFYKMYRTVPSDTTMPGTYPSGYNKDVDGHKYHSEFILEFCIRQELMGKPGCLVGEGIFDPKNNINEIWSLGTYANLFGTGLSLQPACDIGKASCSPPQSPHFYEKLSPGGRISDSFQRLRLQWMAMHWLHFDPSLLTTGDATVQQSEYLTRSIFWANNDQDYGGKHLHDTYSIFATYQIMMHNIKVMNLPQVASCEKIPFEHPDLGKSACTTVDLRSGYYPQLCNFAEGKNWFAESKYQIAYTPKDAPRKAIYQLLGGNIYRLFLWGLIDKLQEDNWMCDTKMQGYRINYAKSFLQQPEIAAVYGAQDQAMFSTLDGLMAKTRKSCPPLDLTKPGTF